MDSQKYKSLIKKTIVTGLASVVLAFGVSGCATVYRSPDSSSAKIVSATRLDGKISRENNYNIYRAKVGEKNAYLFDLQGDGIFFRPDSACWNKVDNQGGWGPDVSNVVNSGKCDIVVTEIPCNNPEGWQYGFRGVGRIPEGYHIAEDLTKKGSEIFIPCPKRKPFFEGGPTGAEGNGGGSSGGVSGGSGSAGAGGNGGGSSGGLGGGSGSAGAGGE